MQSINNILVPVDFSEESINGVEHANKIATKFKCNVHLVHFESTNKISANVRAEAAVLGSKNHLSHQSISENQKKVVIKLHAVMHEFVRDTAQGAVYAEPTSIIDSFDAFVEKHKIDLVVSGTSGSRNIFEIVGGNHTENMIRSTHIPILAVAKGEAVEYRNILIPTDLSKSIPERLFNFCQILQASGAKIHFTNIIATSLTETSFVEEKIHKMAKAHGFTNYNVIVESNKHEIDGLIKIIDRLKPDLVLMKTYQKTNFWSFMSGSLAEELIRESNVPTMTERVR